MKDKYLYLTQEQNDELKKLSNIFKISISTVISTIWEHLIVEKEMQEYTMENVRLYKANKEQCGRHYKPRQPKHMETQDFSPRVINNMLIAYIEDRKKIQKKTRKAIEQQLKETKDDGYQYRQRFVQTARMVKQNPEYFKKLLGE